MIYPTKQHIWLYFLLASAGLTLLFFPAVKPWWKFLCSLLIGIGLLDLLISLKRPRLTVKRKVHSNLPVGAWSVIELHLASTHPYALNLHLFDHTDALFQVRHLPEAIFLPTAGAIEVHYQVKPERRGLFNFAGTDIVVSGPFRLWKKKWFFPVVNEVKVFPNFREISHYALLATHHNLSQMGIKKLMRRGDGKEFHQLREYRKGDELNKIDWKATARHRRLISREYQDERDQQILFLLDCGRRMAHSENGKRLMDEALNSILLLTYVAARQGDSAGLGCFGGTDKWLVPRKQGDSVRSMLLAMYDIETSSVTADYRKAAQDVLKQQNRRALVVLITNSRIEDHDDLLQLVSQVKKKHLVVIANLRESELLNEQGKQVGSLEEAIKYQAKHHYLTERNKLATQLAHRSVPLLDVTAKQLPIALVNSYLELKSSGVF